jgi:threonine dehydrogenase-like Zn-dependent dehydrogenase
LCLVQWARIKGADQIITTDIIEENLQTAQSLGSHTVLNPKQDDIVERILELTEDGVDLAIEAVGLPQTLEQAIAITRPRGVVMCVGFLPAEATLPTKLIDRIIRYELTMRGSQMSYSHPFPGHEWPDTIEAVLSGQLEMRETISHRFPLSAAPEVLQQMEMHTLEYRKIILRP